MTTPEKPEKPNPVAELIKLYERAIARSGLPYRSPSQRMAEQLAATGEAAAYAKALALLTDEDKWLDADARLTRQLRDRAHMDQSDIDSGERSKSKLRRAGLH